MSADRRRGWARGGSAAYRIPARAPTRSPQGQRARLNAAMNPADLHAGRFARRAQARVASERRRASSTRVPPWIPTTKWVGMTAGEVPSPVRRPRPAASAAGPWPEPGRRKRWHAEEARASRSPERREAERGSSVAARQRRAQGGLEAAAAEGGQGRPGYGGNAAEGGSWAAHGDKVGRKGEAIAIVMRICSTFSRVRRFEPDQGNSAIYFCPDLGPRFPTNA